MTYFNHNFASNSDIKKIVDRHEGRQELPNQSEVYELGTEFHSGILERHKLRTEVTTEDQKLLINAMADTFWRDKLCREIMMQQDFRREHEFYRVNRFGLQGVRCKTDGESRRLGVILELKGLSVTSEKQFRESVEYLRYDQGAAFYLNTASGYVRYKYKLIAGISKRDPEKMFKLLIGWDHPLYTTGMEKVKHGVTIWKQNGFV